MAEASASNVMAQTGVNEQARFVLELEFVQCLANPHYLNWLAQNGYFQDEAFLHYLRYLEYFRQPAYATYIRFPHCLFMLELLQSEHFRTAIASPAVTEELHTQQAFYWQHFRANRIKEAAAAAAAAGAEGAPGGGGGAAGAGAGAAAAAGASEPPGGAEPAAAGS
ncbi:MED31 [Scenedesmus sp. PABB004]|nr:MED31 [Scenedesmus sp. PABB004]